MIETRIIGIDRLTSKLFSKNKESEIVKKFIDETLSEEYAKDIKNNNELDFEKLEVLESDNQYREELLSSFYSDNLISVINLIDDFGEQVLVFGIKQVWPWEQKEILSMDMTINRLYRALSPVLKDSVTLKEFISECYEYHILEDEYGTVSSYRDKIKFDQCIIEDLVTSMEDGFFLVNDLTKEMDKYLKDKTNPLWCTYVYDHALGNPSSWPIRYPGATRGGIVVDKDMIIQDVRISKDSCGIYLPEVHEVVKKYIGRRLVIVK